jgi:hypothetical protein
MTRRSGSSGRTSPISGHEPEIEPVPGSLKRSMLVHGGSPPAVSQHGHRWTTMELRSFGSWAQRGGCRRDPHRSPTRP